MLKAVSTCGTRLTRAGTGTGTTFSHFSAPVVPYRAFANYFSSPLEGPPKEYTGVEKSYAEWKWVERLLPPETVPPAPSQAGKEFPSGWKVANPPPNCPYFIPRNKNHMIPVYTLIYNRGQLRETRIRHVEGDIWLLEKEVGKYLKKLYPKKMILTYTQECKRYVSIKGDYSEQVKEWVAQKE